MLREHGLSRHSHVVGKTNERGVVEVWRDAKAVFGAPLRDLHQAWDEVSWRIARAARQPGLRRRRARRGRPRRRPGPARAPDVRPGRRRRRAVRRLGARPKVAILREQGVNSHVETELRDGPGRLRHLRRAHERPAGRPRAARQFQGFVACGGFSYGDTLGAGEGWARSILFNPQLAEQFAAFFDRAPTPSRSASATAAR